MSGPVDNGGPAFPRPAGDFNGSKHGNSAQTGMTLRDYFAAKAMPCVMGLYDSPDIAAGMAYRWADAMLAARRQGDAS